MINSNVRLRYRIDIDGLSYHVECYGMKDNEDGSHVLLGSSPEEELKVGYITIPARAVITVVGEVFEYKPSVGGHFTGNGSWLISLGLDSIVILFFLFIGWIVWSFFACFYF